MKKILFFLTFSIILLSHEYSFGQSDSTTFRDGLTISNASFLNTCIKSSKSTNGKNLNHYNYCTCMLEKMSKIFGLKELNKTLGQGTTLDKLKNATKDSIIAATAITCFNESTEHNSSLNQWNTLNKTLFLKGCENEFIDSYELRKDYDSRTYCLCMLEKVVLIYQPEDMLNEEITDSDDFTSITIDCLLRYSKK